jgi:flap endonuclease-1
MRRGAQVYYCDLTLCSAGSLLGVNLRDLVPKAVVKLEDFGGKSIAIDAYNALYQFLAIIRQPDGTPL